MPARYLRALAAHHARHLVPGGPLSWIAALHRAGIGTEPWALDPQIRERNTLGLYHGTTRLLEVKLKKGAGGEEVVFSASDSYGEIGRASATAHAALMKAWPLDEAAKLEGLCREYLAKAIDAADVSRYANRKEGYWQNRLALYFGGNWTPKKEWIVFDREAVLGFSNEEEASKHFGPIRERYEKAARELQAADAVRFGTAEPKLGNEIDLLALGPANELLCIEVKHGANAAGIYWSPLQAGVYRDALEAAAEIVFEGVRRLVQQKVAVGLLPPAALLWLPEEKFSSIQAVVAVAEPNTRSDCWRSLEIVQERLGAAGRAQVVTFAVGEANQLVLEQVSPKARERDRDKDKDREKEKEPEKERVREKDKEKARA